MSGKRLLDFIALSQAASAVARKTLRLQGLNTQNFPNRYAPGAHPSASRNGFDAQTEPESTWNSQESAPSSIQDVPDGRMQPRPSIVQEANSKLGTQPDNHAHDAARDISDGLQAFSDLSSLNESDAVPKTSKPEDIEYRDTNNSRTYEKHNNGSGKAEAATFSDQDLGPLYSNLFHSPRSANLFRAKTNQPSAWANVEFRKPSQSGPVTTTSGSDEQATLDGHIDKDLPVPPKAKHPISNTSGLLKEEPTSYEKQGEQLGSGDSSIAKESDVPRDIVGDLHVEQDAIPSPQRKYELRESKVPSTRLGRIWQYGGLATSLAFGAAGEGLRRSFGGNKNSDRSLLLSDSNMEAIVSKLSRMRGAALKLGQMISFQDLKMLPAPIYEVLQRVQDSADFMPVWQRNKVLKNNLGSDWHDIFSDFEEKPIAAASIGQVHAATLKSTGKPVAVKIQYPGVANSIDSDLNNLAVLLTASRLLPKGLYLDKTIANARTELAWECDYVREGEAARHFASLLSDDTATFTVPEFIESASAPQVLTLERMYGVAVTKIPGLSQDERDWIATNILRLCLRELFEFRYMQTDPNWTNFLYNHDSKKLELLDFGASREYPAAFTDPYCRILLSAAKGDRKGIADLSVQLGYLTGHESRTMLDAHVDSVLTLAEPFAESGPDVYDFRDQTITDRVRALIPVMLRERLAPPPEETYSLHRKLSGAFLLCARLGSRVAAKELFKSAVHKWTPVSA